MKGILNHRGIGLPVVLGIVVFLLAGTVTVFSLSAANTKSTELAIDREEAYVTAMENVEAALHIIAREQLLDPDFLAGLSEYLGVTITPYSDTVWTVSGAVTDTQSVVSYITGTAAEQSTYDLFLSETGTDPAFTLSPLVTPTTMTTAFMTEFLQTELGVAPATEFTTFQSVVTYVSTLASSGIFTTRTAAQITGMTNPTVSGYWYVNGSITVPNNKSLTVQAGKILVVNGNLTMSRNSTLSGLVVVNGALKFTGITSSREKMLGTAYVKGRFTSTNNFTFGTSSRPAFIVTVADVVLGKPVSGYAYFLCDTFSGNNSTIRFSGGVYDLNGASYANSVITPYALDPLLLYSYGIAPVITAESAGDSTNIKFTFPELG